MTDPFALLRTIASLVKEPADCYRRGHCSVILGNRACDEVETLVNEALYLHDISLVRAALTTKQFALLTWVRTLPKIPTGKQMVDYFGDASGSVYYKRLRVLRKKGFL